MMGYNVFPAFPRFHPPCIVNRNERLRVSKGGFSPFLHGGSLFRFFCAFRLSDVFFPILLCVLVGMLPFLLPLPSVLTFSSRELNYLGSLLVRARMLFARWFLRVGFFFFSFSVLSGSQIVPLFFPKT